MEHLDVNEHGQVMGGLKGFWDATTSAMKDFVREENDEWFCDWWKYTIWCMER